MNSNNPPANLPNEENQKGGPQDTGAPIQPQSPPATSKPGDVVQAPQYPNDPQSLPQEDDLANPDTPGLTDPDEALKRIQREGELNKVPPLPENNIGPDTTGVGQPKAQPVNQGQSLPQSAIPVDNKFDGKTEQFYDPKAAEAANSQRDRVNRGGSKTVDLDGD